MKALTIVFFLLGLLAAFLFATGMDPYSCGIPLALIGCGLVCTSHRGDFAWAKSWMSFMVLLAVGYFAWRMHGSPVQDFGRSDGLLLAGVFGSYWWTMSQKSSSLKWVVFLLWGLLLANLGSALVQVYGDNSFDLIFGQRANRGYPSGLYRHYNHFANFMLGTGLLSFGLALDGGVKRQMRICAWLMFGLSIYGVVLSHSRGATFGLGIGILVALLAWLLSLRRRKVSWAGPAVVFSVALCPLVVAGLWYFGDMAVARRGMWDGCRMQFAGMAIDLIVDKPFLGGGSRSFFFDCYEKWDPNHFIYISEPQYVHNEFLQAAVDYGLIGAGLLLVLFSATIFRGVTFLAMTHDSDGGDTGSVIGSIAALVAMGVQAFFSFVYHVLPDVMLMSFCLASILRQPWLFSGNERAFVGFKRNWAMSVLTVLLGCGIIGFAARDGAAWLALRPTEENKPQPIGEKISRMKHALTLRPDFRMMGELSKLMSDRAAESHVSPEERAQLLEEAMVIQSQLVSRVPQSYVALLNLALLYDAVGRHELSAPIYESQLEDSVIYEIVYGFRFYHALHLLARGHVAWRDREPETALTYFLKARGIAKEIRHNANGPQARALVLEIEKCIKFLEGSDIKPLENDE